MIGSTIMPRPATPPNRTWASGRPEARLFFEPQNTTAISSAREKPRRRDTVIATANTAISKAMQQPIAKARVWIGSCVHSPSRTDFENAV